MQDTTVYQRPGRKKWYLAYWCPKAMKRVWKVTPYFISDPTGYRKALALAHDKGQESKSFKDAKGTENFDSWAPTFLRERYRNPNQALTLTRYLNAWDWLRVFLAEKKIAHPSQLTYAHAIEYVTKWRVAQKRHCGKLVKRNTALTEIKVMSLIMREAIRLGYALSNPCEKLSITRDPVAEKPELPNHVIAAIFAHLEKKEGHLPITDRWMTISFTIALYHAVRLTANSMPMTRVDFDANQLTIVDKGKNGRKHIRTVKIHPNVLPLLQQLSAAGATVTCTMPKMAAKEWHTFFKVEHPELKDYTFHCTRVTVITRLIRAGVPLPLVLKYVGHGSESVNRIYQRIRAEDLSACQTALSYDPVPRPPTGEPETQQNLCA